MSEIHWNIWKIFEIGKQIPEYLNGNQEQNHQTVIKDETEEPKNMRHLAKKKI